MVGWQEKKVLSNVPASGFFNPLQFAQGFAKNVAQGYGSVDKALGGWLPGGSDNQYVGRSKPYFSKPGSQRPANLPKNATFSDFSVSSPFEKDLGRAVDAAASTIAGVQPVVKNFVTNSPDFVQNTVSSGLNNLPVSVNLFGRYYTGLGSKGLELPQSFINDTRTAIEENYPRTSYALKNIEDSVENTEKFLNELRQGKRARPGQDRNQVMYQMVNDSLAQSKSIQKQLKAGNVAVDTANNDKSSSNPFTSLGTSLGNAWFKPTEEGGWSTREKYDFRYGGADKKQPLIVAPEEVPSPSQNFSTDAAAQFLANFNQKQKQYAAGSPASFFGRAIVAKMDPTSFEYDINIPPK